jgi:hypothetical protein
MEVSSNYIHSGSIAYGEAMGMQWTFFSDYAISRPAIVGLYGSDIKLIGYSF